MSEREQTVVLVADGYQENGRPRHVRNIGRCRGCGQQILWALTAKNRKPIPFDDLELSGRLSDDGSTEVVSADGVHWRTCPKAEAFRR